APVAEGEEDSFGSMFTDQNDEDPYEASEASIEKDRVYQAVMSLPARERDVILLRFGLIPGDPVPRSLEYIGKNLRITRERVRQIEGEAYKKLKLLLDE